MVERKGGSPRDVIQREGAGDIGDGDERGRWYFVFIELSQLAYCHGPYYVGPALIKTERRKMPATTVGMTEKEGVRSGWEVDRGRNGWLTGARNTSNGPLLSAESVLMAGRSMRCLILAAC